jgi:hypothetical protein
MSDTTTIPHIKINNADEFRVFVGKLNESRSAADKIKVGDRGRLPMRAVAPIVVRAQLNGELTFEDTTYFPISRWAFGETVGTRKTRDQFSYVITYTVRGDDKVQTLTLSENEIRSYLPNVKGIIGSAFATMAVALHLNSEESETLLTALTNYTVSNVDRIESEQPQDATEEAPKTGDTRESNTDADKAPETPEKAKEESKPAQTTRTRAAAAKTPAKAKAAKSKELVTA